MPSRRPVDVVLTVARALAIPAILLFLVAGSVTWAVNDPGLYRNGFQRYHTAQRSGISDPDLIAIGAELRRYFNTSVEPLAVRAPIYGIEQEVFNQREIAHMYDVKRLVRGTYWVALGSALWILSTLAIVLATDRGTWPGGAQSGRLSGAAPITLLAVVLRRVWRLNRQPSSNCSCCSTNSASPTTCGYSTHVHRLPADPVPRRLLVRRHHARRPDLGAGSSAPPVRRSGQPRLPQLERKSATRSRFATRSTG